jgi:DNA-binding NarL/FixJ family response regulator
MNSPKRIRILLVDDHEMVRMGLKALLEQFRDLEFVGEAASGGEAVACAEAQAPDVVLMDLRLPDMSGNEACRRIVATGCEAKVLILTSFLEESAVLLALESGAMGFVLKQVDRDGLHQAIVDVHQGRTVLPPEVARSMASGLQHRSERDEVKRKLALISPQEWKIAAQVAKGLLNKEIGDSLGLSDKTVKNYLGNLFVKLGMNRRAQVASFFIKHMADVPENVPTSPTGKG